MIHQSNEWCDNFYNNSRQSFPIHLGCTWNCVTGLTVLLWENHFHFPLVLSVSLPPSLLLCLFWMSLLPCFPIQQVEESTLSHTLGVCFTLELHLSVTLSSLVPETPAKLQHFLLYPTAASRANHTAPALHWQPKNKHRSKEVCDKNPYFFILFYNVLKCWLF